MEKEDIKMEDKKPKKEKTPTPQDFINIEWGEVKEIKAGEVVKKPYRPGKRFPGPQVQNEGWGEVEKGGRVMEKEKKAVDYQIKKLIDALMELLIDSINYYESRPNSHRKTAEEYYHDEILVLEEATGKTWQEIKETGKGVWRPE